MMSQFDGLGRRAGSALPSLLREQACATSPQSLSNLAYRDWLGSDDRPTWIKD
jgi:hypothetical protein